MRKEADLEKEILLQEQSLNQETSATLAEKQHDLENIRQHKLKEILIRSKERKLQDTYLNWNLEISLENKLREMKNMMILLLLKKRKF